MGNSQQKLRAKATKLQNANQTLEFDNQTQQVRIKELEKELDAMHPKVDSIKKIDNCAQTEQLEQATTDLEKLCEERGEKIEMLNCIIADNFLALNELKTKSITLSEKDLKILNQRLQLLSQNKQLAKQKAELAALKIAKSKQADSELTKKVANQRVALAQCQAKLGEYKKRIESFAKDDSGSTAKKNDAKSNELKTLNQRFTRLAVERDQYKDKFIWLKQVQDSCFDIVKSFLQHSDGVPSVKIVGELYELYKETSKKLAVTGVTPINLSKKAAVRNTKDDRSLKVK